MTTTAATRLVRAAALVIDVNDLSAQTDFWSGLLDLPVSQAERDWVDLGRLGEEGPALSLQQVPEPKHRKNRLHLDLAVADFDRAVQRARQLGATPSGPVQGSHASRPWQVFRDPEGNEFCLVTP